MMVLPVVFIPFIINFPSGLMIYWLTTNLWTTARADRAFAFHAKPAPVDKRISREPAKAETNGEQEGRRQARRAAARRPPPPVVAGLPEAGEAQARRAWPEASGEVSVEMSGETVGEAKWAAVRELERLVGLDRADVRFQVVSEGERGLLGVGQVPARVAWQPPLPLTPRPTRLPRPPAHPRARSSERLAERIVTSLGVRAAVAVAETASEVPRGDPSDDPGLIGRHGRMIELDYQHVANALAFREVGPTQACDRRDGRLPRAPHRDARGNRPPCSRAGRGRERAKKSSRR